MRDGSGIRLGAIIVAAFVGAVAHTQDTGGQRRSPQDEISLTFEFVWGSDESFSEFVPVRLEIDNPLSNDRGVVTVSSGTYRMQYPIELPARSRRSFVAYLPSSDGMESTVELDCRQANIRLPISPAFEYQATIDIGLVSDAPSLMRFVRAAKLAPSGDATSEQTVLRDFTVRPGHAPDRAIGYEGLELLVLAEGAERMTDDEVAAAQRYVLSGGTLVITGGAVSPILRDERWAAFIPGTDPKVVNVAGSRVLSSLTGFPLTQLTTLTQITPAPGTTGLKEDGVPLLWYRRCGLGMVAYWAFDPFVAPVRTYVGRARLFMDTAIAADTESGAYKSELGVVQRARNDYDPYFYDPGYGGDEDSVFRVEMPSTGKLFLILACYFVVVVPLNFLVLGRMGRGQLAWVTSPVVGLIFASMFLFVARDLYSTSLSRATSALVVAHEGSGSAYVVGRQQLFFPSGGRYDLGFQGVEFVTTESDYYQYYGPSDDTGFSGDLVDVGEVVAPRAGVSNLSFREFYFGQSLDWPHRFPLQLQLRRDGDAMRATGSLTNDSPYGLTAATLWIEGRRVSLGDVKSGETREFFEAIGLEPILMRSTGNPPSGKGLVALTGAVAEVRAGTSLGDEKGGGATRLLFTYASVSPEGQ